MFRREKGLLNPIPRNNVNKDDSENTGMRCAAFAQTKSVNFITVS